MARHALPQGPVEDFGPAFGMELGHFLGRAGASALFVHRSREARRLDAARRLADDQVEEFTTPGVRSAPGANTPD
ncbi:MAG: hypothetical protein OXF56_26360 [Rhodobacteraceae bacterium]|nr:hypothetical protein [Paracoccaceae bacterium]